MFLARQKGSLCFMWIRGQIGPLYCSKWAVVSTLLIYVYLKGHKIFFTLLFSVA